jgi:hypothetical protein
LKVAIVGYGILGNVAAYLLKKDKIEVHVFDEVMDLDSPKFFSDPNGPNSLVWKTSRPKGSPGNAIFWGGAITNAITNRCLWPNEFIETLPAHATQLRRLGFPKLHLQIFSQSLDRLKIRYYNKNLFFKRIDQNTHNKKIMRHFAFVETIYSDGNKIALEFRTSDKSYSKMNFDRVIVCAGSIGTFNLLNKSNLIRKINEFDYFDHPTWQFGEIKLTKSVSINKFFPNKNIVFGKRPNAIVVKLNLSDFVTIRIKPIFKKSKIYSSNIPPVVIIYKFLNRCINYIRTRTSKEFSISISLDIASNYLRATTNIMGEISHVDYGDQKLLIDNQLIAQVDSELEKIFGEYEKSWTDKIDDANKLPSAHYSGFIKSTYNGVYDCSISNFRLNANHSIYVPGAVSFPGPVLGHPTYLALLSLVYVVDTINTDCRG